MSVHNHSALMAVLIGAVTVPIVFVPYVAWTYRRYGIFSWVRTSIALAGLIYLMALWTYTILPLPDISTMDCSTGGVAPQFVPFASLKEIDFRANGVRDPMLLQLIANVALFVPFGMLLRYLTNLKKPILIAALSGFIISLTIETTQLTGVFGLYPCSYRMFDVDDLITNTAGAVIGALLAPLLRFLPGQKALPEQKAREVKPSRRLLAMFVDYLSVNVAAFFIYILVASLIKNSGRFGTDIPYDPIYGWVQLVVSMLFLLAVPLIYRGATLGQLVTFLKPIKNSGAQPGTFSKLRRYVSGVGGYFVLSSLNFITEISFFSWAANLLVFVSIATVVIRHPRGLSGYVSGMTIIDSRDIAAQDSEAKEVDPRSLGVAVIAVVTAAFVILSVLAELLNIVPTIGFIVGALAFGLLILGALAFVPYLLVISVVTVRREGVSLAKLLPAIVAIAIVALLTALAAGFAADAKWLIILTVAALAVAAYLGLLFIIFLLYGIWYAHRQPSSAADAVVVLGSQVFEDGVPPLLAARIDRGIEILNHILDSDLEATTVLVCSGGQGADEPLAEAAAMGAYAIAKGVSTDRVLEEAQSRNTIENLKFSKALLEEEGLGTSMIVATNDFHAFRAAILARETGVTAQVVGAPTGHYYFPAAIIREFIGVLSRSPLLHAAIGASAALLAGGLAYLFVTVF